MIKTSIREKFIKLRRAIKEFSNKQRLKNDRIYIPKVFLLETPFLELFAVIRNIKPVVSWNIPSTKIAEIKKGCEEIKKIYGLFYEISDEKYRGNSIIAFHEILNSKAHKKGDFAVSISRHKKAAVKANYFWFKKFEPTQKSNFFSHKFGEIIGYPKCCLKFGDQLNFPASGSLEKATYDNYLWQKAHIRSFMNSKKISPLLNIFTGIPLISHVPCHLNCQESKIYAKKILKELSKENPEFVNLQKYFLFNLHSCFWYYTHFILFEGEKNKNIIKYDDYLPIPFFYRNKAFLIKKYYKTNTDFQKEFEKRFKKLVNLIKKGNLLKMEKQSISIWKKDKKLGEVNKKWEFESILF